MSTEIDSDTHTIVG